MRFWLPSAFWNRTRVVSMEQALNFRLDQTLLQKFYPLRAFDTLIEEELELRMTVSKCDACASSEIRSKIKLSSVESCTGFYV